MTRLRSRQPDRSGDLCPRSDDPAQLTWGAGRRRRGYPGPLSRTAISCGANSTRNVISQPIPAPFHLSLDPADGISSAVFVLVFTGPISSDSPAELKTWVEPGGLADVRLMFEQTTAPEAGIG
ncbi:MAG: hypothetical protein QNJ46_01675 [Leptolyngbyaceae cyanobacterium MO_188.B28]|nr:hypothetical protein [Leptolyngbyaceae cyanobacterium MO_188.B28]